MCNLAEKVQLVKIRNSIKKHIGDRVRLKAKVGRKNVEIRQGVIESIYPSVFIVKLNSESTVPESRVSYSYIDVLTKAVEIQLYRKQA